MSQHFMVASCLNIALRTNKHFYMVIILHHIKEKNIALESINLPPIIWFLNLKSKFFSSRTASKMLIARM